MHNLKAVTPGKRAVTADADLRSRRFLGLSSGYWLRAQVAHHAEVAEAALSGEPARIKPWSGAAAWYRASA